jgi:hypothetical protein
LKDEGEDVHEDEDKSILLWLEAGVFGAECESDQSEHHVASGGEESRSDRAADLMKRQ